MSRKDTNPDALLDRALESIARENPDASVADAAAERVWAAVEAELGPAADEPAPNLAGCADFQSLIPALLTDSLQEGKTLLLQDHLRECVPCRRALKQARKAREAAGVVRTSEQRRRKLGGWSWALAAAAMILIAIFGIRFDVFGIDFRTGGMVTIERIEGELIRVGANGATPVRAGEGFRLSDGDALRTTRGSTALLELEDGSTVELNERTELGVLESRNRFTDRRKSSTLDLRRGNIIVEAAPQGDGRMLVDTGDAEIAVRGTVFAVNHGIQGTRVSVIEGAVEVDYAEDRARLEPGQQLGTRPAVRRIPIAEEIAWSGSLEKHLALLKASMDLGRELDAEIPPPELRFDPARLERAPSNTVIYVAFPNIADTLDDAYELLQQKVATNPVLDEWWTAAMTETGDAAELEQALRKIRDYGDHFGEEIAIAVPRQDGRDCELGEPVILSDVSRPDAFVDFLRDELTRSDRSPAIAVYRGALPSPTETLGSGTDPHLHVWLHEGRFVAAHDVDALNRFALDGARSESHERFISRLRESYERGVEWVVGVDLETLLADAASGEDAKDRELLESLGLLDLQHLVAERKHRTDRTDNSVLLSFDRPRRGVASWLAAPAPMGSLQYVSDRVTAVGAFAMKEPDAVVEELFGILEGIEPSALDHVREFEREKGVDIRRDFAAPLGGEFAFALDGPLVPIPSWKLVMEVYDPAALQRSMAFLVDEMNAAMRDAGAKGLALESFNLRGSEAWKLTSLDTGLGMTWTYDNGYMIAVPSRALLQRALQTAKNGQNVFASPRFRSLMPEDRQVHFSALFYHHLGPLLGSTVERAQQMLEDQRGDDVAGALQRLQSALPATVAYAYGEEDRIRIASTSEGGMFSFAIRMLLNTKGMFSVHEHIRSLEALEDPAPATVTRPARNAA